MPHNERLDGHRLRPGDTVISFPFENQGIHTVAIRPAHKIGAPNLVCLDAGGDIFGHTALDRDRVFIDRVTQVCGFLSEHRDEVHVLVAPSSVGYEAVSIQRALADNRLAMQCRVHALDINPVFHACARMGLVPDQATHHLGDEWAPYLSRVGNNKTRISAQLSNAVNMLPPQDIQEHEGRYSVVSTQHLLYYFEEQSAKAQAILAKAADLSDAVVVIDAVSFNQDPQTYANIMAERGFGILNPELRHITPSTHARYATFGGGVADQAVFFCKKELLDELRPLIKNDPRWDEPVEASYDILMA